jgi:hypothetical protein
VDPERPADRRKRVSPFERWSRGRQQTRAAHVDSRR